MVKNVLIVALAAAVLGLGYYAFYPSTVPPPVSVPTVPETQENDAVMCAQVITPARNPETSEIREFPTPCDVPDGWEVIQNDIPELELNLE